MNHNPHDFSNNEGSQAASGVNTPEVALSGGKHYLAPHIIARFPPHIHYVEPYFGGGQVLFAKPEHLIEGHSEVVNDLNGALQNF